VTRLGERVAAHERPLEWISATRLLALPLHPRLDERTRRQFVMGEFEAAVFVVMKEVEVAVRERAGLPDTMIGTDLVNKAFGDQGPLSHSFRPKAEREGVQSLYRGAMSVFKNPTSHRSVEFSNPVEAAEMVLLADLLLRMLDRPTTNSVV
jgi:uncharacterized protein (TIGR02391 family)